MAAKASPDNQVAHWAGELADAKKRFRTFWEDGDTVVDAYRLQKSDGNNAGYKDKYNILYSSTETMRPNLYAASPRTMVKLRSTDTATDIARAGALLLEGCIEYVKQEEDFDEIMNNVVEDYMLPGIGTAWVRYDATFTDATDSAGNKIPDPSGEKDKYQQVLLDEMVKMEYVYWQDFLVGTARTWSQVPWVAKRLWLTKAAATSRFGAEIANKLSYASRDYGDKRNSENVGKTAEAWEIWDKLTGKVYWYAEGVPSLLDTKDDPLRLKNFFPCPRPLRAISNTRTMVPKALYSQYKAQAETLNTQTRRIRLLSEALKVTGIYDGSQKVIADALNPAAGNRMIAVDNWAMMAANKIEGSVQFFPLDAVASALNELLKAREVCKNEIYEITGFSDIMRGISKASETLGAQNIKSNVASARIRKMQSEVQRFARDMLAMVGEITAEHCSPETIALFSGIGIPTAEEIQANPDIGQQLKVFEAATKFIANEAMRVSSIDIETDSTLLNDTEQEREDRAKFLAAAGAFLQQAVPAMEASPELGPLLGDLLMFTVRSFPSSRTIEASFEAVQRKMQQNAAQGDQDKNGEKAKQATEQARVQADAAAKAQELQVRQQNEATRNQNDAAAEQNRHAEKMEELGLRGRELALRERELAIKEREVSGKEENETRAQDTARFTAVHNAEVAEAQLDASIDDNLRQLELEYDTLDREDAHKDADREVQRAAATFQGGDEGEGGGEDA